MLKRELTEYADRLKQRQQERDAIVDKGRRAYRFGIELRNCPLTDSAAALWKIGWENERSVFERLLQRNGGSLR